MRKRKVRKMPNFGEIEMVTPVRVSGPLPYTSIVQQPGIYLLTGHGDSAALVIDRKGRKYYVNSGVVRKFTKIFHRDYRPQMKVWRSAQPLPAGV